MKHASAGRCTCFIRLEPCLTVPLIAKLLLVHASECVTRCCCKKIMLCCAFKMQGDYLQTGGCISAPALQFLHAFLVQKDI